MIEMHTFVVLAYKESVYLEDCILSCINQNYKSNVVIATSTPNEFIYKIAYIYKLNVFINYKGVGIGADFNFAATCIDSDIVTVAHQDDLYDPEYSEKIILSYKSYPNSLILFSNYYEIRDGRNIYSNKNINIKKKLLFPLRFKRFSGFKLCKRLVIAFGNSICCPAVSFVTKNIPKDIFLENMKSNVDWSAWERISKRKGNFILINEQLMGHRIHGGSTTSEIILDDCRSKEDFEIFQRFWPKFIAKYLCKIYKKSEESNFN